MKLRNVSKTDGGRPEPKCPHSQEEFFSVLKETKSLLYHFVNRSRYIVESVRVTGTDKEKRTRTGKMCRYRVFRDALADLMPIMCRLIELWDISIQELCIGPAKGFRRLSARREIIAINKALVTITMAKSLGVQYKDIDQLYIRLRSLIVSIILHLSRSVGPEILVMQCFFKYRKRLGYADE